ncbi:MAG: NAD(P)-dependent oxidoreductase [Candidatus Brocadiia bacterium]
MIGNILVTEPEFEKGRNVFENTTSLTCWPCSPEETKLAARVREEGSRAVVVGIQRYAGDLYDALGESGREDGAIIARFGVGHDGIDKKLARKNGIVVTNTPGVLNKSVAEHVIALMLSLARYIPGLHGKMIQHKWKPQTGTELGGKNLLVVGFGSIGKLVASAAASGLGMKVTAADLINPQDLEQREGMPIESIKEKHQIARYVTDVDGVLVDADVVTLHVPGNEKTEGFFGANRMSRMKREAFLINTSRGSVVNETELYDMLAESRIAGAALDVFQEEPYRPEEPERDLRSLPNVVLTPHVGSNTRESNERMARAAFENVKNFLLGERDNLTEVGNTNNVLF